jgi:hypothetical protein
MTISVWYFSCVFVNQQLKYAHALLVNYSYWQKIQKRSKSWDIQFAVTIRLAIFVPEMIIDVYNA